MPWIQLTNAADGIDIWINSDKFSKIREVDVVRGGDIPAKAVTALSIPIGAVVDAGKKIVTTYDAIYVTQRADQVITAILTAHGQ